MAEEFFRHAEEAEVGLVAAVDGAFAVGAGQIVGRDVAEVVVAFFPQLLIDFPPVGVLFGDLVADRLVDQRMREPDVLHQIDGRVRPLLRQVGQEIPGAVLHDLERAVLQAVDHVLVCIDPCHNLGHRLVHARVSAESQIDALLLQRPADDVGVDHARPGGAAALGDARAVEHDGLLLALDQQLAVRQADGRILHHPDFDLRHPVVERQVSHVVVVLAVHAADHDLRLGGVFPVGDGRADELPVLVLVELVQVDAPDARSCHVMHDEVVEQRPADTDAATVGRKTDGQAGRVEPQLPDRLPRSRLHIYRQARICKFRVVKPLVDEHQVFGIRPFQLGGLLGEAAYSL